jgi:hypothetical protein
MINKEIVLKNELPLYEVQEVSLLDAMLLLKGYGQPDRESSIARADELMKRRASACHTPADWSLTGS